MMTFYLCDGEVPDCDKKLCHLNGGPCKHTAHVEHAKNFEISTVYVSDDVDCNVIMNYWEKDEEERLKYLAESHNESTTE